MSQTLTITVGPEMFNFASFETWKYRAKEWYAENLKRYDLVFARTIAIDAKGQVCASGKEFAAASYPVRVFAIDPEAKIVEGGE